MAGPPRRSRPTVTRDARGMIPLGVLNLATNVPGFGAIALTPTNRTLSRWPDISVWQVQTQRPQQVGQTFLSGTLA